MNNCNYCFYKGKIRLEMLVNYRVNTPLKLFNLREFFSLFVESFVNTCTIETVNLILCLFCITSAFVEKKKHKSTYNVKNVL